MNRIAKTIKIDNIEHHFSSSKRNPVLCLNFHIFSEEKYEDIIADITWDFSMFIVGINLRNGYQPLNEICFKNKIKNEEIHNLILEVAKLIFKNPENINFYELKIKATPWIQSQECKLFYAELVPQLLNDNKNNLSLNLENEVAMLVENYKKTIFMD